MANQRKSDNRGKLPMIDESPIPEGKRHVAEVSVKGGMTSLRMIVRNIEDMKPQRMVKPWAKVEEGKWHVNKHVRMSEPTNPIFHQLTHTQKRRQQRKKSAQTMKMTLQMLAETKDNDKKAIWSSEVDKALEKGFCLLQVAESSVQGLEERRAQEEATEAQPLDEQDEQDKQESLLEYLNEVNLMQSPVLEKGDICFEINGNAGDALANEEADMLSFFEDSLLDTLLAEETSPSAEVDVVSILPSEFWAGEEQPSVLEGDVCADEVEWVVLLDEAFL